MDELAIKAAFLDHLHAKGKLPSGTLIANEFAVDGHSRRADLAFFGNRFIGIEIKSSLDSLQRLTGQILTYQRFFDEVHAVVAKKHVLNALEHLPVGVAVWSVEPSEIRCHRKPGSPARLEISDLCLILHTNELRRLVDQPESSRLPRKALVEVAATFSNRVVRTAVVRSLEKRFRTSSNEFWSGINGGNISNIDLVRLSRFGSKRTAQAQTAAATSSFWDEWRVKAQYAFGSQPS